MRCSCHTFPKRLAAAPIVLREMPGQVLTPNPLTRIRAARWDPAPLTMEDVDNGSIQHNATNVKFQCTVTHGVECQYIWPGWFECERVSSVSHSRFTIDCTLKSSDHLSIFSEQLRHKVIIVVGYNNNSSKRLEAQNKVFMIINMANTIIISLMNL